MNEQSNLKNENELFEKWFWKKVFGLCVFFVVLGLFCARVSFALSPPWDFVLQGYAVLLFTFVLILVLGVVERCLAFLIGRMLACKKLGEQDKMT